MSTMTAQQDCLHQIERCVSWLAAWMIHHANHVRPGDEIKIGGYQIRFLSQGSPIGAAEALRLVTVPGRLADIDLQRLGAKP